MRLLGTFIIVVFLLFSCENPEALYELEVNQFRNFKNELLKTPKTSPFSKDELKVFEGLKYYPPDISFKIPVQYQPEISIEKVSLFNDASIEDYHYKVGKIYFSINNKSLELIAFKDNQNSKKLFIPFKDKTNSGDTYGAGRYVEVNLDKTPLEIDFNYSYNPYCAYNHEYSCPVPPVENQLDINIPVGEKKYIKSQP